MICAPGLEQILLLCSTPPQAAGTGQRAPGRDPGGWAAEWHCGYRFFSPLPEHSDPFLSIPLPVYPPTPPCPVPQRRQGAGTAGSRTGARVAQVAPGRSGRRHSPCFYCTSWLSSPAPSSRPQSETPSKFTEPGAVRQAQGGEVCCCVACSGR